MSRLPVSVLSLLFVSAAAPAFANGFPTHNDNFEHSAAVSDQELDTMRGGFWVGDKNFPLADFSYFSRLAMIKVDEITRQVNANIGEAFNNANIGAGATDANGNSIPGVQVPNVTPELTQALAQKTSESNAKVAAPLVQYAINTAVNDTLKNASTQNPAAGQLLAALPQNAQVVNEVSYSAADLQNMQNAVPLSNVVQNNMSNVAYFNQTVLNLTVQSTITNAAAVANNSLSRAMDSAMIYSIH